MRGIFNEFAQKLIFQCNLLFICGGWRVPGRVRVSSQSALSVPPTPSNNTQKPRENGIPAKANIVPSWLKKLFVQRKGKKEESLSSAFVAVQQQTC